MGPLRCACVFVLASGSAHAQLRVTQHELYLTYEASAFGGSASDTVERQDPVGIVGIIPEATLTDETGTLAANVFGLSSTSTTPDGFRMEGIVTSDVQQTPFYAFRHLVLPSVFFDLDEPTEIRVQGTLAYEPEVASLDYFLSNATVFEIRTRGQQDSLVFDFVAPWPDDDRTRTIDQTIVLPAGSYQAYVDSESNFGVPLSMGLLNVNTAWDLSVTVVPASASLAIAPAALLAWRRRR